MPARDARPPRRMIAELGLAALWLAAALAALQLLASVVGLREETGAVAAAGLADAVGTVGSASSTRWSTNSFHGWNQYSPTASAAARTAATGSRIFRRRIPGTLGAVAVTAPGNALTKP